MPTVCVETVGSNLFASKIIPTADATISAEELLGKWTVCISMS
jgi:hypothetical protein